MIRLTVTIVLKDNLPKIRHTPINKYIPTPIATKTINNTLGIDDNSLARVPLQ